MLPLRLGCSGLAFRNWVLRRAVGSDGDGLLAAVKAPMPQLLIPLSMGNSGVVKRIHISINRARLVMACFKTL